MADPRGVWIDTETGAIVRDEPEHGRQLVVPGDEISDDVQARLDALPTPAQAEDPSPAQDEITPPVQSPGKSRATRKAAA